MAGSALGSPKRDEIADCIPWSNQLETRKVKCDVFGFLKIIIIYQRLDFIGVMAERLKAAVC
ncbi:MAG: hypothetical protein HC850_00465 [Rhodomicrobium sp.]|nr:hypothetical protein [Rhodomicrobium sp.]